MRRGRTYRREARQDSSGRVAFCGSTTGGRIVRIGAVGGQRRKLGGFGEGLVVGIEQTLQVGRGDGAMGLCVLLGIDEHVGEPVDGRDLGHGRERGAIVVGGALVVAAGLLVTGGQSEDGGIGAEAVEGLTQPDLGLVLVVGGESGADGAFKVARRRVLHGDGLEEGQSFLGAAYARIAAGHGLAHGEVIGKGLRGGVKNVDGALRVAVVHGDAGAAHAPVGPDVLHRLALRDGEIAAAADAHQGRIERAVVAHVVEQPGVLNRRYWPAAVL